MNILKSFTAVFAVLFVTVCTVFFLATSSAFAQGYVGGSFVQGKLDGDSTDTFDDLGVSYDDKDTGFKIFGGFPLSENASFEVGYLSGLKLDDIGDGGSIEVTSFYLAGKALIPVNDQVQFTGKLAMHSWDTEVDLCTFDAGGNLIGCFTDSDGTDLMYGIGMQFNVSDSVDLVLDFENYTFDSDSGDDDIRALSVGIQSNF